MNSDTLFMLAVEAGCQPFWYDGMCGPAWHCGCPEVNGRPPHACDQQCSMITQQSLQEQPCTS